MDGHATVSLAVARADILELLHATIDVVIQFEVSNHRRSIKTITFRRSTIT